MADAGETSGGDGTIDYAGLVRGALLDVVRGVLARVAADGLPGEHHFFLTFGTTEDGVELPPRLRREYPDEMTIVLQHQFWGLEVDDRGLAVALRFAATPERLFVPWTALRRFVDPSVGFGLRLQPEREAAGPDEGAPRSDQPSVERSSGPPAEPSSAARAGTVSGAPAAPAERGKVVDFGAFRRKPED